VKRTIGTKEEAGVRDRWIRLILERSPRRGTMDAREMGGRKVTPVEMATRENGWGRDRKSWGQYVLTREWVSLRGEQDLNPGGVGGGMNN